jgi:hypothetical protein
VTAQLASSESDAAILRIDWLSSSGWLVDLDQEHVPLSVLFAGRIDEDDHGSRAYDARGTFVGRYNRFSDQTYDNSGRVFALSGDALTALIFGKKRK